MKGDFSRFTYDPARHYSRVNMQQGRVQLDADWNEQVEIQLHYLRALAFDLIGPYGGPLNNCGFSIGFQDLAGENRSGKVVRLHPSGHGDFTIGRGRYYVAGLLCENDADCLFSAQPHYAAELLGAGTYLVFLDVWERHITCLEDPHLREVALGGPDTTTRSQVVWMVRAERILPVTRNFPSFLRQLYWRYWQQRSWNSLLERMQFAPGSEIKVRCREQSVDTAETPVDSTVGYHGQENRLYRVEIHAGGQVNKDGSEAPTFKWSRENGSVVFPVLSISADSAASTTTITLGSSAIEHPQGLTPGSWVEILDDDAVLLGRVDPLRRVLDIDQGGMRVIVDGLHRSEVGTQVNRHPLLRRWDQVESGEELVNGAVRIQERGASNPNWIALEDGIEVQFQPGGTYRSGDYWQFPARAATSAVEWPQKIGPSGELGPASLAPRSTHHDFAPLAIISMDRAGHMQVTDLRRKFKYV